MRNHTRRACLALLLLLAMTAQLFLPAAAMPTAEEGSGDAEIPTVTVGDRRFMSEQFFGSDGTSYRINGESLVLPLGQDGKELRYTAAAAPQIYDTPNNAVRMVISNYSPATYFQVRYTYVTEQGLRTETQRVDLGVYAPNATYLIRTDYADSLVNLTLIFPEGNGGSVVLHAMETVRVWSRDREEYGTVQYCRYDGTAKTVTVKGSVAHDVTIFAAGATLGLFRLAPNQTLEELTADPTATPVAESAMSIVFELQAKAIGIEARHARYAVLICMPNGERFPLTNAYYATAEEPAEEETAAREDFKGIDTTLIATAIDSNVGSAIVDVSLSRLVNELQSGYLYTVEDRYYYLDRGYIAELDEQIRSLSGAACKVYLRFLVDGKDVPITCAVLPEGGAEPADPTADLSGNPPADPDADAPADMPAAPPEETPVEEESARYFALRADDPTALRDLYAYTTFLCTRYLGMMGNSEKGEIAGIILGSHLDMAEEYNAAGEVTLPEYTETVGKAYAAVALAARDIIPNIALVIPVSDRWNAAVVGSELRQGNFAPELLVESLSRYLSERAAPAFSLMIEGTHNPYGLSNTYFEPINTDGEEEIPEENIPKLYAADAETDYLSSENIDLLDRYLDRYAAVYSALAPGYLFHWTPDGNTSGNALSHAYVYHYYRLFTDPRAKAFFVSFREKEEAGNPYELSKIKYLLKYVDTPNGSSRTSSIPETFGAESWASLIPGFNRAATEHTLLVEGTFGEHLPEEVKGSYTLFDFATANSVRGWYAGNRCESLSLGHSATDGKTLDAVMLADHTTMAEYSDIAYRFEKPFSLTAAPYLRLTAAVSGSGDPDAVFEIKLVIGSDAGCMEAKQVVKNGEMVTLSLNTNYLVGKNEITYIRLCAKTVMGDHETFTLHLRELMADSREYDSEALHELYEESQKETEEQRRIGLVLTIAILLVGGTVVAAVAIGYREKMNEAGESAPRDRGNQYR